MITKTYIEKNLREINSKFKKTKNQKESEYFSKLAILELCGWIEISMDSMIFSKAKKLIKDQQKLKKFESRIINRTSGFSYVKHFQYMMVNLIGYDRFLKIESEIDQNKLINFKSQLGNLKKSRDSLAHTYTKGITKTINAPSLTINMYEHVYKGLIEFEKYINLMKT